MPDLSLALSRVLGAHPSPESQVTPDRYLARVTCLSEHTWHDKAGRYETVLCLDETPFAEVAWDGGPKSPTWRRATGVRVATLREVRAELELHARRYLDLPDGAANAVVAGLVAGATNGASAALRFRTHMGGLDDDGEEQVP